MAGDADARADDHSGAEGRRGQIDRAEQDAILAAPMPPAMPSAMPPNSRATELPEQLGIGQRAQDVGDREARWERELQAVDEDRRVEHADADAEHADAQHVQDQLPHRRLRQAQPGHRLDHHGHGAHAGHRCGRGLDVVRAVTSLRAVAERDRRSEDAREYLPADEEAEREIHVRRGEPAQRTEDEDADDAEQGVILPRARSRKPRPARSDFLPGYRCGGHGRREGMRSDRRCARGANSCAGPWRR